MSTGKLRLVDEALVAVIPIDEIEECGSKLVTPRAVIEIHGMFPHVFTNNLFPGAFARGVLGVYMELDREAIVVLSYKPDPARAKCSARSGSHLPLLYELIYAAKVLLDRLS